VTDAYADLRAAEQALAFALGSTDRLAWVDHYTDDAVFDAGGHAVVGREALLEMARGMRRLSDVEIRHLRTDAAGDVAAVWAEASWTSGEGDDAHRVDVRGVMVWRRGADGRWRIAVEHIG
jgi:ketosteroid isomerase-like protein